MPELGSIPAEPARWDDRLQFAEVQIADRAQCLGGRAALKAVRQAFQPRHELNLGFDEAGDVVIPTPSSAAVVSWAARAERVNDFDTSGFDI